MSRPNKEQAKQSSLKTEIKYYDDIKVMKQVVIASVLLRSLNILDNMKVKQNHRCRERRRLMVMIMIVIVIVVIIIVIHKLLNNILVIYS